MSSKTKQLPIDPELAAVIGHPIAHSRSPEIFAFLAERLGKELVYKRVDIETNELQSLLNASSETGLFVGWNVTIPHKESICFCLDGLTPGARAIGAANVVEFTTHGTRGHNTDWLGVLGTLQGERFAGNGRTALLYGAGGAARAVAFAAGKLKLRTLWIYNRSEDRAHHLCHEMGQLFPRTSFVTTTDPRRIEEQIDLLINATPLGMKGTRGRFVFPKHFSRKALAFDLVYRPRVTPFLKEAKRLGLSTVGGLPMLAGQAIATWEIWFGKIKSRDKVAIALVRFLEKRV